MKEILLTSGNFTIVDDEDYETLSQQVWYEINGYAVGSRHSKNVIMHREIVNPPKDMFVDHINGVKLDNRRENLRICTAAQNRHNRGKQRNNTSGFKGVYKVRGKWAADINIDGRQERLGIYDDPAKAARAYDVAAKIHHGEFAWLNFSD